VPERSSSFGSIANTLGRVAARGRRLADRQADLALRHGKARDGVHHQHHVAALVAEVLRDRGGGEGRLDAHERGLVGGRHDDDRARQALGAEVALDELAHLAASLADEADHVDLRRRRAGDHAQQRGLADARAGEDAEPLAATARHEGVQRADAERHALGDPRALERIGRRDLRRARLAGRQRAEAVERAAEAVQRAAEQAVGDVHAQRAPGGADGRARSDPRRVAQRHQKRATRAEADDLGRHGGAPAAGLDAADLADLGLESGGLDDQTDQVAHATVTAVQVGLAEGGGGPVQPTGITPRPPARTR
jgi:hypothetical protein